MPAVKKDVRQLARQYTASAVKTLVGVMQQPKAPASARVQAAQVLLDRGWGKAAQPLTGADGGPLTVLHEILGEVDGATRGRIPGESPRNGEVERLALAPGQSVLDH